MRNEKEHRARLQLESSDSISRFAQKLEDYLDSLVSIGVTRKSIDTIQRQSSFAGKDNHPMYLQSDGFWKGPRPRAVQYLPRFLAVEKRYRSQEWFPAPDKCFQLEPRNGHNELGNIAQLVRLAYQQDVELLMFFSPIHARLQENMRAVGVWEQFETAKRQVVSLNLRLAQEFDTDTFPLWDFSGYNSITTEALPATTGPGRPMKFFFDPTHPTPRTGSLLQDVVFASPSPDLEKHPDFGVRLTAENIDWVLAEDRRKRERWARANSDVVEQIRQSSARRPV